MNGGDDGNEVNTEYFLPRDVEMSQRNPDEIDANETFVTAANELSLEFQVPESDSQGK